MLFRMPIPPRTLRFPGQRLSQCSIEDRRAGLQGVNETLYKTDNETVANAPVQVCYAVMETSLFNPPALSDGQGKD